MTPPGARPDRNIENNPMQSTADAGADALIPLRWQAYFPDRGGGASPLFKTAWTLAMVAAQ